MQAFQSASGITRRNIIIVSPQNQVYSLDRQLLSTRRKDPNQRASFGF